jgi:hypothetical protein
VGNPTYVDAWLGKTAWRKKKVVDELRGVCLTSHKRFTYLEHLADVVDYIRDRLERWVVAVEEMLEAEHNIISVLGSVEEIRRQMPCIIVRLVSIESLQHGKLGTVALHAS